MEKFLIEENKSILEAMQKIDTNARKILFLHKDGKLLASVSDGDIRRWILDNGDINASIKCAANFAPVFLEEERMDIATHALKKYSISAIPIVDKNKYIKQIIFSNELPKEKGKFKEKIPVVIMAGGYGKRLSPYTNILPKPLIPIGEYPIVEHIINSFCEYGCKEFYLIVNYKRNMIKSYFEEVEKDYRIYYEEEEKPLGTGGGLSLLQGKIHSTFILTNCDILIEDDLSIALEQHKKSKNKITVICSDKNFTIPYGVIEINNDGSIAHMKEKPKLSFLTNTGCYIVEPEVIENLDYKEHIDFPTVIEKYKEKGEKVGVYSIAEDDWLDMGQFDELEKMKQRLGC